MVACKCEVGAQLAGLCVVGCVPRHILFRWNFYQQQQQSRSVFDQTTVQTAALLTLLGTLWSHICPYSVHTAERLSGMQTVSSVDNRLTTHNTQHTTHTDKNDKGVGNRWTARDRTRPRTSRCGWVVPTRHITTSHLDTSCSSHTYSTLLLPPYPSIHPSILPSL